MQSMHWFISHISVSWGPLSHTFFWYMYISKCHIDWWYVLSTRKGMWPTRRQILLSWEKWPNNLPPLPLPCLHTTVLLLSRFGYVLPQGSRSRPREMISSFVNGTPHSPPLSPLSLMYTSLGRPSFPMRYTATSTTLATIYRGIFGATFPHFERRKRSVILVQVWGG